MKGVVVLDAFEKREVVEYAARYLLDKQLDSKLDILVCGIDALGWDEILRVQSEYYDAASRVAWEFGYLVFDVNVLFDKSSVVNEKYDVQFRWDGDLGFKFDIIELVTIPSGFPLGVISSTDRSSIQKDDLKSHTNLVKYNTVVLGGTFDRLHSGHKILLSMASLICTKRLVVGVTDFTPERLQKKKFYQFIESVQTRMTSVSKFVYRINKNIKIEVVPITDDYGPTRNDPDMDVIIASEETATGCDAVNKVRRENGLKELDIKLVKCLVAPNGASVVDKISSSAIREFLSTFDPTKAREHHAGKV